jgi:hypothetical protein
MSRSQTTMLADEEPIGVTTQHNETGASHLGHQEATEATSTHSTSSAMIVEPPYSQGGILATSILLGLPLLATAVAIVFVLTMASYMLRLLCSGTYDAAHLGYHFGICMSVYWSFMLADRMVSLLSIFMSNVVLPQVARLLTSCTRTYGCVEDSKWHRYISHKIRLAGSLFTEDQENLSLAEIFYCCLTTSVPMLYSEQYDEPDILRSVDGLN